MALLLAGSVVVLFGAVLVWQSWRWPRRRRVWVAVAVALAAPLVLAVPSVMAARSARTTLVRAEAAMDATVEAVRAGQLDVARARLDETAGLLAQARARLDGPAVGLGRALPVWADNLVAARRLVAATDDVVAAARVVDDGLGPQGGEALPLAALGRPAVGGRAPAWARRPRPWPRPGPTWPGWARRCWPRPCAGRPSASRPSWPTWPGRWATPPLLAEHVDDLLGGSGPRRYFLAVQNSAELRATGGFMGSWGALVADGGELHLETIDRVASLNHGGDPDTKVLRAPEDYIGRYARFGGAGELAEHQHVARLPHRGPGHGRATTPSRGASPSTGCWPSTPRAWPRCWR